MIENHIYVAMNGNDWANGSIEAPLASFKEAQARVRKMSATAKSDIIVNFRGGQYFLDAPIELLSEAGDSGKDGFRVIYQAFNFGTKQQEAVVLSGGIPLSGWTLHDQKLNIWKASIGNYRPRQLFINGKRAERATVDCSQGNWIQTDTGYKVTGLSNKGWNSGEELEFVYTGIYPWSEARIGVESVETDGHETIFTMKQPAYDHAVKLYHTQITEQYAENNDWDSDNHMDYGMYGLSRPTIIENSMTHLEKPGSFAIDTSRQGDHFIYYIPCHGEDMQLVHAVVPVLESIIYGKGTLNNPLRNVVLQGLTFAHATWQRPSSPDGFLHYHGGTYYTGGDVQEIEWAEGASLNVPTETEITPNAVRFECSENITLQNNHFIQLGTGAVEFTVQCSNNIIRQNLFNDISATAIMIGTHVNGVDSAITSNNRIENNHIQNIGCEFHGSSAILLMETQFSVIAHNQINDVPHCGIVVYGGDRARGVEISKNLVYNTMKILADGGGIYLAQSQGTSEQDAAIVKDNVIYNTITSYNFSLYTDYGAKWIVIENNVIHGGDAPIVLHVMPPVQDITYKMNYWDQHPQGYDAPPEGIILDNNYKITGETIEFAISKYPEAQAIVINAGLNKA